MAFRLTRIRAFPASGAAYSTCGQLLSKDLKIFAAKYCIQRRVAGRILRHQLRNRVLFLKRRLFAQIH
ncbi:MAG: hypothetical protein ACTS81_03245 [Arsenophonus sp. ER-BJ3-MAG3]